MSAVQKLECAVIGAGVVGLAVARAFAIAGKEVIILESEASIGTITSARNSEVIHAGIYYPKGSNKAKMCVEGRRMLYEFCDSHNVPYNQCGKYIVATSAEQVDILDTIQAKAAANGVHDLKMISGEEAMREEPNLSCLAALWSPSTGIIDTHSYMLSLLGDAENEGAMLALNTRVCGGTLQADGTVQLSTESTTGDEVGTLKLECDIVVNCAGLSAPHIARLIHGLPPAAQSRLPTAYFAKGNYYGLEGPSPFSRLIYPVPAQAGLGVHATIDLGGRTRFGPDVEWLEGPVDGEGPPRGAPLLDYTVAPERADSFYDEVRLYWPQLPDGALVPDYSGVRPKISAPGEPAADFTFFGPEDVAAAGGPSVRRGRGLLHLLGIESPGLTSSLAIAEHAQKLVLGSP